MAEWTTFYPSALYPKAIEDILSSFDSVVSALELALTTMADVVDLAGTFVIGMVDAQEAAIEALYATIDAVIQQLTQTGVYHLFYQTPSFAHTITPRTWLSGVANSLYDRMDTRRPILVDPNAYVGAVVVMASSDTLVGLMTKYNNFYLTFKNISAKLSQISYWPDPGSPFEVVPGVGQYPNWSSKKLQDVIPGLSDIVEKLYAFMSAIAPASGASSLYGAFAALLRDKAALLSMVVSAIMDVLNMINALLNFQESYILPIYGTGDAVWFRSQLLTSTGGPMDLGPEYTYTLGTVFLTTGGVDPVGSANALLSMFGVSIP